MSNDACDMQRALIRSTSKEAQELKLRIQIYVFSERGPTASPQQKTRAQEERAWQISQRECATYDVIHHVSYCCRQQDSFSLTNGKPQKNIKCFLCRTWDHMRKGYHSNALAASIFNTEPKVSYRTVVHPGRLCLPFPIRV